MSDLLGAVMGQLGGDRISQIAGAIGADPASTEKGIAAALPTLLGGLAANAAKPEGAAALDTALDAHDDSVFGNFSDILSGGGSGAGIVKHVLGDKQEGVANALAGSSGLSVSSIAKLLPMLAPLLMGVLGQQKKAGAIDMSSLGGVLGGQAKQAESAMPDLGSIFSMLGGGSGALGGLAGMLGGGGDGGSGAVTGATKKGGLGAILGKLLGRR